MKKFSILIFSFLLASSQMSASNNMVAPMGVDSIFFGKEGSYMTLDMNLNLTPTKIASCNAMVMTPLVVTSNGDSISLPSVGIYGRRQYINYMRNQHSNGLNDDDKIFKSGNRLDTYHYRTSVPYTDNMNGSQLVIHRQLFGCAGSLENEKWDVIGGYVEITPPERQLKYFEAVDNGPVTDTLAGKAYIDFIVNKSNIDPSYRRNPVELLKIQQSIDTVLNDKDVRITGIWLKGFASPEGKYEHNAELAIDRTNSLKHHLNQLYNFDSDILFTDYEPEDWEGLRKLVAKSNLNRKEEILDIIESDMEPDSKEHLIAKRFPDQYDFIYHNFYPGLRHTEYRVIYEVKRFDNIDKIREVMRSKPNRLTLREFYLLGNASLPGSDEFNEVYETAVRMYPDDTVANINAANAALQRNDLVSAEKYLAKAGDSKEAVFARATLAFAKEDYEEALKFLDKLPDMSAAQQLLDEIYSIKANQSTKYNSIMLE